MEPNLVKYDSDKHAELVAHEGAIRASIDTVSQKIRDITDSDKATDEVTDRSYLRLCHEHQMLSRDLEIARYDIDRMREMKPLDSKAQRELSASARFYKDGLKGLGTSEIKQFTVPKFAALQKDGFETINGIKIEPRDMEGVIMPPNTESMELFIDDTLSNTMSQEAGDNPGTAWNDSYLDPNVSDRLSYFGGVRGHISEITTRNGLPIKIPLVDDASEKGEYMTSNTQAWTERDIQNTGTVELRSQVLRSKYVDLNLILTNDVAFASENFVNSRLARRNARATNEALTIGDGADDKPRGFVTDAGTGVTTASQTNFTSDELLQLEDEIDIAYFMGEGSPMGFNPPRPGRTLQGYMLHQKVKGMIRRLKANNQYIWKPGLAGFDSGDPPTILDRRYVINNFMDSEKTAGKKLLAFGNFGYYTFRNVAWRLRGRFFDSATAANLNVRFCQWERNYGRFTGAFPASTGNTTEAVKLLVMKA